MGQTHRVSNGLKRVNTKGMLWVKDKQCTMGQTHRVSNGLKRVKDKQRAMGLRHRVHYGSKTKLVSYLVGALSPRQRQRESYGLKWIKRQSF